MSPWEAALLGLVQGLTEFLPVSSSGHLALVQRWLGWNPDAPESVAFVVVVHLGTLVAVLGYFRRELLDLLLRRWKAAALVGLATLPLVFAIPLEPMVKQAKSDPILLGLGFWAIAAMLIAVDPPGRTRPPDAPPGIERLEDAGPARALAVGFAQLAALPFCLSRSGSTISCGQLVGLSPRLAGELSFLMSIPAVLGATAVKGKDIGRLADVDPLPVLLGFLVALGSGLAAIALLRWIIERRRLWVFAPYVLVVGALSMLIR